MPCALKGMGGSVHKYFMLRGKMKSIYLVIALILMVPTGLISLSVLVAVKDGNQISDFTAIIWVCLIMVFTGVVMVFKWLGRGDKNHVG